MADQQIITDTIIAGIDDATKCPCIGSIFIAGVIADQATIEKWKQLGVKDSKLVAAKKREKFAKIIKETALGFSIAQITPHMIDNKNFNLNEWEMLTVLTIVKKLYEYGNPADVIVDNWETTQKGFRNRLKNLLSITKRKKLVEHNFRFNRKAMRQINFIAEHYADEKYTIVGAASILAKVASDKQYRSYKRKYGNFGSGSPADPKTRLFVWQHRHNPLPIIRTSWNTYKTLAVLNSIEEDPLYPKKTKSV
jgi:ribonuclease HII